MMAKKKNPAAVALGIGAVGSSGSSLESDDAYAKAGIAKVAAQLK